MEGCLKTPSDATASVRVLSSNFFNQCLPKLIIPNLNNPMTNDDNDKSPYLRMLAATARAAFCPSRAAEMMPPA